MTRRQNDGSRYTTTRARGLQSWRPSTKSRVLLAQVAEVLEEYDDHLPLTVRQLFYRLVGRHGFDKTELAYCRLLETLNRARRAGFVPFDAIRDDGVAASVPTGFHGMADFLDAVRQSASTYRRDRLADQPVAVEVWTEAGGMVPQAARVAHPFGVPVYSSGGFDSLTTKYDAARRFLARSTPTLVLHVGDLDPSGLSIFDSLRADVSQIVLDLAGLGNDPDARPDCFVRFRRVAVTPEQVERYGLATAPAKATDRRGDWQGGTVQAEALAPDDLAHELRQTLNEVMDLDALDRTRALEEREREELRSRFAHDATA